MIVRKLQEMEGTDREVRGKTWVSRRLLLADDRMGFSMHDTILGAGTTTEMHYKNHLEAVYCIAGKGKLKSLRDNREWVIEAGTIYALDKHDHHVLIAETELRMVCVFNPPLVGPETHGPDLAYPLMTLDD